MQWFRIYIVRRVMVKQCHKRRYEPRIEHYGDLRAEDENRARAQAYKFVKADYDVLPIREDEVVAAKVLEWNSR